LPQGNHKVLMSGFGVGLSWGSAIVELNSPHILPMIEI
jgi:3-oxoacyl-[acyl-carrier-protein] synthase III